MEKLVCYCRVKIEWEKITIAYKNLVVLENNNCFPLLYKKKFHMVSQEGSILFKLIQATSVRNRAM